MNHELKIWPQFYARVKNGTKTFEVRNNDRCFQFGDTVELREWDPTEQPTSRKPFGYTPSPILKFKVGYVHVLNSNEVIFSLLKPDKS